MHLISILSIVLSYLGIFQQPQFMVRTSHSWQDTVGLAIIMTTFLLDNPCLQKDFSTKVFLRENWWEHSTNLWVDIQNLHQSSARVHHQWYVIMFPWLNYTIPSLSWWNSHRCRVLCTREGMLTLPDTWCHHRLISCDVPMTNSRREPCGGWMIVLFMVVSFITGCVNHFFQSVSLFSFLFFSNHSFWPCHYGCLTVPCLWEISSSSQMIRRIVSWLLGLDGIFRWAYDYFNSEV